jgi:phage N-6-adenine-methyltransferase
MSGLRVVVPEAGELTSVGRPEEFRSVEAKINVLIGYGARMADWELLERAVDAKLDDQAWFVTWWADNVRRPGGDHSISSGRELMAATEAEDHTKVKRIQVVRWGSNLKFERGSNGKEHRFGDRASYRSQVIRAACVKAGLEPPANHRAEGTGENEWYTPERYLKAARAVMGGIDLDPATSEQAQLTVRAKRFYTIEDDGLTKPWQGRVWLNPPYAQPAIGHFAEKMAAEVAARRVSQAIMLTHNYTDTVWFHTAAEPATAVCFTKGRIKFVDVNGVEAAPTQGQAFFYYGSKVDKFLEVFSEFGLVLRHA